MKHKGLSFDAAARGLIERDLLRKGLRSGIVAFDRDGNVAMPYNTEGMLRGAASDAQAPEVKVY